VDQPQTIIATTSRTVAFAALALVLYVHREDLSRLFLVRCVRPGP
jgi:hypothetical protein